MNPELIASITAEIERATLTRISQFEGRSINPAVIQNVKDVYNEVISNTISNQIGDYDIDVTDVGNGVLNVVVTIPVPLNDVQVTLHLDNKPPMNWRGKFVQGMLTVPGDVVLTSHGQFFVKNFHGLGTASNPYWSELTNEDLATILTQLKEQLVNPPKVQPLEIEEKRAIKL